MRKTRLLIEKAMKTNLPVHLVGETGTGKTLAAETIHRYSNPKREMIREECGQLTTSLTDSILFGHTKGAYSGAVEERKGLIALADKSTLFLDEIQDLSLEVQAKLLGGPVAAFFEGLPLYTEGLYWLLPAALGGILGALASCLGIGRRRKL